MVDEFFAGSPLGSSVFKRVQTILGGPDQVDVRVSKSQLAFRRRRAVAYLWKPGQYLASPDAEVVLSISLPRRIDSSRFKEVVQPAKGTWMHHLEIRGLKDLDAEVEGWLREAAEHAPRFGSR